MVRLEDVCLLIKDSLDVPGFGFKTLYKKIEQIEQRTLKNEVHFVKKSVNICFLNNCCKNP